MSHTCTSTLRIAWILAVLGLPMVAHSQTDCVPDLYENDDSAAQASLIAPNTTQDRSLCPAGDDDWVFFTLASASAVVLETSGGSGDTELWLYDDSLDQLDYDDDGNGSFSLIERQCGAGELPAGGYYAKVAEYYDDPINDYQLALSTTGCGSDPDIRIEPLELTFSPDTPRSIYVEIDWMETADHSHRPSPAVIDRIAETFANAGYSIILDVSNSIPHQDVVDIVGPMPESPNVQALMDQHFDHAGDDRYFYSLWIHEYSYYGERTGSSGLAELPGRVHIVSLGTFRDQTGTFSNQVGTFIHELGHNLNQKHGGVDHNNFKPNYLSVMNYHYQLSGIGPALLARGFANTAEGFDDFSYSHGQLENLDENALDENFGIGLGRAVDWSCDGVIEASVAHNIQDTPDFDWCDADGTRTVLSDFDNWTDVTPHIRSLGIPPRSATVDSEPCMSWSEYQPLQEKLEQLRAVGLLPPDGPPTKTVGTPEKIAGGSFTIFNDGTVPLEVTAMTFDVSTPWIQWEPTAPFSIAPGGFQQVFVYVDFDQAPAGQHSRRLLVFSNDPDESPYPGGVNLVINGEPPDVPRLVLLDGRYVVTARYIGRGPEWRQAQPMTVLDNQGESSQTTGGMAFGDPKTMSISVAVRDACAVGFAADWAAVGSMDLARWELEVRRVEDGAVWTRQQDLGGSTSGIDQQAFPCL